MTEAQRNYLADLAAKKNIRFSDTGDVSVSWASNKIEELKAMPDADFSEVDAQTDKKINRMIERVITELHRWNFQR